MNTLNRRQFLNRTTAAAGAAAFAFPYIGQVLGANERLNIACIGVGGKGDSDSSDAASCGGNIVAICDVDKNTLAKKGEQFPKAKQYQDYRKLLEEMGNQIDGVTVSTPDHNHGVAAIRAMKMGKHCFCQKPLTQNVQEARMMRQLSKEKKLATQMGNQGSAENGLRRSIEVIQAGVIGNPLELHVWSNRPVWPQGFDRPSGSDPVPAHLNWDAWLGPAPKAAWNLNRTFYNFRWFYDYSGGQITNFGVHYMDFIRQALGEPTPRAVTAMGGRFAVNDNREIPDTCEVLWDFGKTMVVFVQYNANGAPTNLKNSELEIRGTKGTMYLNSGRWEVVPEKTTEVLFGQRTPLNRGLERGYGPSKVVAMEPVQAGSGFAETTWHTRNFLDCMKSRQKCHCDIEIGHLSTSACILGHIALRTRSLLDWDAKAEKFTNNDAANKLLSYKYRAPYKLG
jgi:predicted dehydrogenase